MARRDDDEAPWLAEVESDGHTSTLVPRGRFIGGVTLFVLLLLLVVIGIYFIAQTKQDGATGTPVERAEDAPLIAAEPGPYKVKPADPGGLKVPGFKDTMHCISEGNCPEPRARLDRRSPGRVRARRLSSFCRRVMNCPPFRRLHRSRVRLCPLHQW